MADGDGVTDVIDLSGNGKGVALNVYPDGTIVSSSDAFVTPQQFGAVADGVTDDYPAFAAAIAYLKSIAAEPYAGWFYKGSPKLFIPAATDEYYLSNTLDITHTLIIEGEASNNGMCSRLKFADNKTGIRIQGYNTNGGSGVDGSPYHYSGASSVIRNVSIIGSVVDSSAGLVGGEGEYHGIHLRASAVIEDVYIDGFRGDGIHLNTSVGGGGAAEGNGNNTQILRPRITNVRDGIHIDGADANACTIIGLNATYCRRWAIWDSSFLGNTHIGHHSANAGLVPGVSPCIVSHGGNWYAVRVGQTVGASTNAPTGSATDNQWWIYMNPGAPSASFNVPAWSNGITLRAGGSYCTDSANGYNVFINCYSEGGEAPAQLVSPTLLIGGLLTAVTTGNRLSGQEIAAPNIAKLGEVIASVTAGPSVVARNSQTLSGGLEATVEFAVGADPDIDGTALAQITAVASNATPNNNEPNLFIRTRAFASGTMTNRIMFAGASLAFHPTDNNVIDLGATTLRWKTFYSIAGNFSGNIVAVNATLSGDCFVVDDPYSASGWDGSVAVPTKNAIRDKIEAIIRPTIGSFNVDKTAADADNNSHFVASGASKTLTLGNITAGTGFTVRFTTAWSLAVAGGLSKNGAAPGGVTTGSVAANSLITFLHEGAGVWVATGAGLT